MKTFKKLFIFAIILFTSFIFVRAEEVKEVNLQFFNLPQADEFYQNWGEFNNAVVTNTDKFYVNEIDTSIGSPSVGQEVKVLVTLINKSSNDWLSENSVVKATTPAGEITLQRDWAETSTYTYYFNYVIPDTPLTLHRVQFRDSDGESYGYVENYVAEGITFTIRDYFYDSRTAKVVDYYTIEGDESGTKYYIGDKLTVTKEMILIPHLKDLITHKLSFVIDGKQQRVYSYDESKYVDYIEVPENKPLRSYINGYYSMNFELELPDGHYVDNWYTDESYKHQVDLNDPLDGDTTIYSYVGYYAYADSSYAIGGFYGQAPGIVHEKGDDQEYYETEMRYNTAKTVTIVAEPTEGYAFKGWRYYLSNSNDYSDLFGADQPEIEWEITFDHRYLEAVFEPLPSSKKLSLWVPRENEDDDSMLAMIYVAEGKAPATEMPTTSYYEQGYEGKEWYTDRACTQLFDFTKPLEADTNIYVKMVATNKVLYSAYVFDGKQYVGKYLERGQKIEKPLTAPQIKDYEFNFWAVPRSGYYSSYSDLEEFDFNTPIYIDTDVYPEYSELFDINFNTMGGGELASIKASNAKYRNLVLPTPTRYGYEFKGWFLDEALTKSFDANTYKFKKDITLYASWEMRISTAVTNSTISITKGDQNTATVEIDDYYLNQKYTLYKSTNKKKWTKVGVFTDKTYYVKGITFGQKTYYRVTIELNKKKVNTNTVNITVKPDAATGLQVVSAGSKNIKIAWDKAPYSGYEVQRSENGKKWKKVATISKAKTISYNNKKLKNAKTYYYRVRPYKKVGSKKVYGGWSNVVSAVTGPAAPKAPSVKASSYNTVTVTLKSAKTATSYQVQRSTNKKKGFTTIATTTELKLTDTVDTGKTYYYRSKACNDAGVCSGWSKVSGKVKASLSKPALNVASLEPAKVTVTIGAVEGAEGYEIQKSTKSAKKGFKKLTDVTETTFEDTAVTTGKTVYYKVRAYRLVNGKRVFSGYTKVVKVKVN